MKYIKNNKNYGKPQVIELDLFGARTRKVVNDFKKTVKNKTVLKVESVENQMLYDKYCHDKQTLSKLIGEHQVNEKWLFHGTRSENVMTLIQQEGFRKEFNTKAAYGKEMRNILWVMQRKMVVFIKCFNAKLFVVKVHWEVRNMN
eukprot:175282_1